MPFYIRVIAGILFHPLHCTIMYDTVERSVIIASVPLKIWQLLTVPGLMQQWMADEEVGLKVDTTWRPGSTITITGFHHLRFENKGTVLEFDPGRALSYTHLSSISRLEDRPENYATISFSLIPVGEHTTLTVRVTNFPTESIYRHLAFYWSGTLHKIKRMAEGADW